jgi:hypothetical protein
VTEVDAYAVGDQHAGRRLKFDWAVNGSPAWHAETVAGPGSVR